jgi:ADP-ribose pyrophosphatase YjhB (NUDIX family)
MTDYKEYIEDGIIFQGLQTSLMPKEEYIKAHRSLVIFCHDVFIEYQGGILLIIRNNEPARDILWPLGGRVLRGLDVVESAKRKVRQESSLELSDVRIVGMSRTYFRTDPFGHGRGTDTVNAVLFAKGHGELHLDHLHERPSIVKPSDCTEDFMNKLVPYVRDYLRIAIELLSNK